MMINDMTVGRPVGILVRFSLPLLLSMACQQLYSIADSVIVGRILGEESFAAVSVSYPVTVLFVAFAGGASIGASVVTSQLFGEKRMPRVRTSAYTSLIAMAVAGLMLTLIGAVLCKPLLRLMNTDELIFEDAAAYLLIYIAAITFLMVYNAANGIFTALGDSLTPLCLLVGSSVLNVVLDIVLVIPPFSMGVRGAAWATFIAQGISSVAALLLVLGRVARLPDAEDGWRLFDTKMLRRIVQIAVPSICQQSFVSVGQLFVQGSVNSFPVYVQSGYGGAFKINIFTISCINTMGNAVSSFTAQNVGAQKWERIREGRRAGLLLTGAFAIAVSVLTAVFSGPLMTMFTTDPATKEVGQQFLWTVCPFYAIITFKIINDGVFRGAGAMKAFMVCTFFDLGLRVIASYVLPLWLGHSGVWWAFPIGWVSCTVLSVFLYRFGKWTHATDIRSGRSFIHQEV